MKWRAILICSYTLFMKNVCLLISCLLLISCAPQGQPETTETVITPASSVVAETQTVRVIQEFVSPIAEYKQRNTKKRFGDYIQDRFTGYHVGDDIEYTDAPNQDIPIYSIADGVIDYKGWVSGYGGLLRVRYQLESKTIHALYGHIALESSSLQVGESVRAGQFLANLGKGESDETDGERKHLHFGLYEGTAKRINGYEQTQSTVANWINPRQFLEQRGVVLD